MRRYLPRVLAGVLVLAVAAVVAPRLLADDRLELVATYAEVGDLVERAHVRFGDVPVGEVADITLTDDHRAAVTLAVDPEAHLPDRATAVVRMTAVLGERYVDLVPDAEGGRVVDGADLPGAFESDIELAVGAGSQLLGALSADRLAQVIEVGHATFAGRGQRLGRLLDDLDGYVGQLSDGRDELADFIDASERLGASVGPDADLHAAALEDLGDLTEVLADEEERLVGALEDLSGTAEVSARIVRDNRRSLDDLLTRLSRFAAEVLRIDDALENLLLWLPRHNLHVPGGVVGEHSQVLNDFTLCGVTDEPDNAANACIPDNPGQPNDPAPGYQVDACTLYHVDCEDYPEGVHPHRGELEEARTTPEERRRKIEQAEDSVDYRREPRDPAPRGLP